MGPSKGSRTVKPGTREVYCDLKTAFCLFSRCLVLPGARDIAEDEIDSNSYPQGASSRDLRDEEVLAR